MRSISVQQPPFVLTGYQLARQNDEDELIASLTENGASISLKGRASGVVGAFVNALEAHCGKNIVLVEYNEHTLNQADGAGAEGSDLRAVECRRPALLRSRALQRYC